MMVRILMTLFIVREICGHSSPIQTETDLRFSSISVVEALLASLEVAASHIDSTGAQNESSWFEKSWLDASACIANDYRHSNITCTEEMKKDTRDVCAIRNPESPALYHAAYYHQLVSRRDLARTATVLDLAAPAFRRLLPGSLGSKPDSNIDSDAGARAKTRRRPAKVDGAIPAVVHQTWKGLNVGEETDFKDQMDGWEAPGEWVHLVWTDRHLNRLIALAFPWLQPTLRKMRRPVDKIDVMRYLLLFTFGGVYMDADQVRVQGDLHRLFGPPSSHPPASKVLSPGVPLHGLAGGVDPAVIASVARHPALAQMLLWVVHRVRVRLFGGRHELTGPEGWRRTLTAYRRCEDQDEDAPQARYGPTVLFNQVGCGCWGAEVIPKADLQQRLRDEGAANTSSSSSLPVFAPIPAGNGASVGGMITSRDVPLRMDSYRVTQKVALHGHSIVFGYVNDAHDGPILKTCRACVGFHRCSQIYGSGPEDWDGGVTLGNDPSDM